jgi:hypothetical protein
MWIVIGMIDRATKKIREATDDEDALLRHLDQDIDAISEREDAECLIWRNPDNTISVAETLAVPKEKKQKKVKKR